MDISERLYVEIVPYEGERVPQPHPIVDGHFDPKYAYKVLGMYNASETSECYFVLSNPERQIWFISQRHLRAFGLFDGDRLFFQKDDALNGSCPPSATNGKSHFVDGHSAQPDRLTSRGASPGTSSRSPVRVPSS
jgi:hypothetical protein